MLFRHFDDAFAECKSCLEAGLPLPAYDQCMIASHAFNTLDARKAISDSLCIFKYFRFLSLLFAVLE